jgi:Zn-dependent peptidase ImmA (M78 family)
MSTSGRISPEREMDIAELAEEVANSHCPGSRVDPIKIIKANDITLSFGRYADAFDGLLEYQRGRFHIYSNLDRIEDPKVPRARFTLGHELGHFYINEHRNALKKGLAPSHPSFCEYASDLLVEREADHFASNLLMPRTRFMKAAKLSSRGLAGILSLAYTFGTSVTSTAIRYVKDEVEPCVVIKWQEGRFAWSWSSVEMQKARFRRPVKLPQRLLPRSPTARALAGETTAADYFSAGTRASSWFPRVGANEGGDLPLVEQAMALGKFGILTFLYPESYNYRFARS